MPPSLEPLFHSSPPWRHVRQRIIERDKGICRYCGETGHQVDYKKPPKCGGKPIPANLVCCCAPCLRASNDAPYPTFADKTAFILAHRLPTGFNGQHAQTIKGIGPRPYGLQSQPVAKTENTLRQRLIAKRTSERARPLPKQSSQND